MDTTTCPDCGEIAEVLWRAVMDSTDGPVEHSKILCLNRHWFLLPTASLERSTPAAQPRTERQPVPLQHW
ncbi:MAG: hypothetical protein L0H79_12210 [Intrasporangium sp.]|uniref:hypothetical protein n=1 Tax=Intrasporangium sp. TaxID=1925024 RepID=UPI002649B0ED|nr:hypothetical protein [Intrasporangium sp.]MDN5796502.1 hypothetical protein [Intrasporangium sp.]